jgi:hypothetical protein
MFGLSLTAGWPICGTGTRCASRIKGPEEPAVSNQDRNPAPSASLQPAAATTGGSPKDINLTVASAASSPMGVLDGFSGSGHFEPSAGILLLAAALVVAFVTSRRSKDR